MTRKDAPAPKSGADRESTFWEMMTADKVAVSDEALAYFRAHPDEIDEVTANSRVHRLFLWIGTAVGVCAMILSKLLAAAPLEATLGSGVSEFLVDLLFEGGVALMGAALTAYFMGVLLNAQQKRASAFRKEIRRRLREEAG